MRYLIFCNFSTRLCLKYPWKVLWSFILAGLCLAGCTHVFGEDESGVPARVSFLDVGQGLSVLLSSEGHFAMFDTGPDSLGVVDTLLARGVDTLEWVLVSHYHRDHAGGFMEFPAAIASGRLHVRRLYVGPDMQQGFIRDSVLRVAHRFGIPVDTIYRGSAVAQVGEDTLNFSVLWPPKRLSLSENAASVVLEVSNGKGSILLAADLDSAGERQLLELSPTLSANVLQVPHHGSKSSNSLAFLAQVQPEYAVVSVGEGNSYGHPAPSVMRKLFYVTKDSASVFRTDKDGSVEFELVDGVGVILDNL